VRLLRHRIRCKSWGEVVSLSPVVEGLKRVEKGVDKTASELAIARLSKEIQQLQARLAQQEQSRKEERNNNFFLGPFLFLLGVFFIWGAQGHWSAWLWGLIFCAGGISLPYGGFRLFNESDEEIQLTQQVENKNAELERHQQIVKS